MDRDETARREAEGRTEAEQHKPKTEPPAASGPHAPAQPSNDDAEDSKDGNRKGGYGAG